MESTTTDPKLGGLFTAIDNNSDGFVDWSDYDRLVNGYLDGFKVDRNSRKAHALHAVHQMFWCELVRHGDGKNRMAKDQFVKALQSLAVDTSRFNMIEGVPHAIFDVMDTDDDNEISKDEFKKHLEVWNITDPAAMDDFDRVDTDGDGYLSRQEYLRSWREFFYSPDPDTPGSLFFGRTS